MISIKNGQDCTSIDCQDRGFLYGDGCFTTVRVQQGHALLWPRHVERLIHCAQQLSLQLDHTVVTQQVSQFLHDLPSTSGTLKIIVSRGTGQRGYLPPVQAADVYLQFFPSTSAQPQPAIAIESGVLPLVMGHVMPMLAGLKTLNRLEQVMLRQALANTAWPEALVADIQGNLIEGVSSNCFFYMQHTWYTPILEQAGIAGVMRAEILAQMSQQDIPHLITHIPKTAIDQIEAMFFCNALSGMVPVKVLQDRPLALAPVAALQQQLRFDHI